jgi:hypothetical protein
VPPKLIKITDMPPTLILIMSRNANDRGWFVKVKTRLTTKRKEECEKRRDYIYIAKG